MLSNVGCPPYLYYSRTSLNAEMTVGGVLRNWREYFHDTKVGVTRKFKEASLSCAAAQTHEGGFFSIASRDPLCVI